MHVHARLQAQKFICTLPKEYLLSPFLCHWQPHQATPFPPSAPSNAYAPVRPTWGLLSDSKYWIYIDS